MVARGSGVPPPSPLPREFNISFADFRERYARHSLPVIISGAISDWPLLVQGPRARIKEVCGDRNLYDDGCGGQLQKGNVKFHCKSAVGRVWAGLVAVPPGQPNLQTVGDLLSMDDGSRVGPFNVGLQGEGMFAAADGSTAHNIPGKHLYLQDAAIDVVCPALFREMDVPRYFPVDYQLQARNLRDGEIRHEGWHCSKTGGNSWPSIFVGGASTGSGLHVDRGATRFWMAVLEGTKTFRLLAPQDTQLLTRSKHCKSQPGGQAELCNYWTDDLWSVRDAHRRKDRAIVWEGNVSAGDIIFVPENWAHQVRNLDETVAISYNWVDEFNLPLFLRHLQLEAEAHDLSGDRSRLARGGAFGRNRRLLGSFAYDHVHGAFPRVTADEVVAAQADAPLSWGSFFKLQQPAQDPECALDRNLAERPHPLALPPAESTPSDSPRPFRYDQYAYMGALGKWMVEDEGEATLKALQEDGAWTSLAEPPDGAAREQRLERVRRILHQGHERDEL